MLCGSLTRSLECARPSGDTNGKGNNEKDWSTDHVRQQERDAARDTPLRHGDDAEDERCEVKRRVNKPSGDGNQHDDARQAEANPTANRRALLDVGLQLPRGKRPELVLLIFDHRLSTRCIHIIYSIIYNVLRKSIQI